MESKRYYENIVEQSLGLIESYGDQIATLERVRKLWVEEHDHAQSMLDEGRYE